MPCKNAKERFFKKALDSVFSQVDENWQLMVINDHTDLAETLRILKKLGKSPDIRVSLLKNESRMITGALNTGMRHANTPYVCSLHCDDFLDDNAIKILHRYIQKYPEVDYFHSSRIYVDECDHHLTDIVFSRNDFTLDDFKNRGPVKHLHCWKVKSALAMGGMDEDLGLHGADDYDFPWCMAEAGFSFKAIKECLYYYRDHRAHERLTTHVPLDGQINELKMIWKKHGLTDIEVAEQIEKRTRGYLRQALYLDERDKEIKERQGYDIRRGWRETYHKKSKD
jgi:glycosyltransferase involved in cell wall biosynthesis